MIQKTLSYVAQIGVNSEDPDEIRLQKTLLVVIAIMVIPAAVLWGIVYLIFGEGLAASIPLSYAVISSLSIFIFSRTKRYQFYRFSQLFLIVLLPFMLMVALGGFVSSSAVIIWALLCPMGALVFSSPRSAVYWFLVYLGLVVLSGFLQTFVRPANNLSPLLITLFFVLNIGAVSGIAFVLLYYFVSQKDNAFQALHTEQQKGENLLLNILPKEIAAILKNNNLTIADHFEGVTILFADIAGFTPMSAQMAPAEVVDMLNEVFSHFDNLAEKHNLEKIKTIGDCYMVAAGIPLARPDHAQAIARMALEMRSYASSNGVQQLDFRIGINSGPVIAGVIGRKKFIYDLWGDAVNTASRMESHGTPGKIQITESTYELVKNQFICEERGTATIKGKGEMRLWYLIEEKR